MSSHEPRQGYVELARQLILTNLHPPPQATVEPPPDAAAPGPRPSLTVRTFGAADMQPAPQNMVQQQQQATVKLVQAPLPAVTSPQQQQRHSSGVQRGPTIITMPALGMGGVGVGQQQGLRHITSGTSPQLQQGANTLSLPTTKITEAQRAALVKIFSQGHNNPSQPPGAPPPPVAPAAWPFLQQAMAAHGAVNLPPGPSPSPAPKAASAKGGTAGTAAPTPAPSAKSGKKAPAKPKKAESSPASAGAAGPVLSGFRPYAATVLDPLAAWLQILKLTKEQLSSGVSKLTVEAPEGQRSLSLATDGPGLPPAAFLASLKDLQAPLLRLGARVLVTSRCGGEGSAALLTASTAGAVSRGEAIMPCVHYGPESRPLPEVVSSGYPHFHAASRGVICKLGPFRSETDLLKHLAALTGTWVFLLDCWADEQGRPELDRSLPGDLLVQDLTLEGEERRPAQSLREALGRALGEELGGPRLQVVLRGVPV